MLEFEQYVSEVRIQVTWYIDSLRNGMWLYYSIKNVLLSIVETESKPVSVYQLA
jgi:hypothetical protein